MALLVLFVLLFCQWVSCHSRETQSTRRGQETLRTRLYIRHVLNAFWMSLQICLVSTLCRFSLKRTVGGVKTGFHWSRSQSQIRKRGYDLKKIKNWIHKQTNEFDRIGARTIRSFPCLSIRHTTPSFMIKWKLDYQSTKQKQKNQPITRPGIGHCDWFIFPPLLPTPTI